MRKRLVYDPENDYYALMGVPPSATLDEIQRAYRHRAKEVHPDTNPERPQWATRAFKQLTEAYQVLSDPGLRARYDRLRWPHQPSAPQSHPAEEPPPHYDIRWRPRPARRRLSPWLAMWFAIAAFFCLGGLWASLTSHNASIQSPLPGIEVTSSNGCHEPAWTITRLAIEVDVGSTMPRALRVTGTAEVELFTVELHYDGWAEPEQTSLLLGPVRGGLLARLDILTQRGVSYVVMLKAVDGARPACQVAFRVM
jgi:hypothetical protein